MRLRENTPGPFCSIEEPLMQNIPFMTNPEFHREFANADTFEGRYEAMKKWITSHGGWANMPDSLRETIREKDREIGV